VGSAVKDKLNEKIDKKTWKISHKILDSEIFAGNEKLLQKASDRKLVAVLLPGFYKILSHFTQPGQVFADELSGRLRVIACLDRPNMTHSEDLNPVLSEHDRMLIFKELKAGKDDAFVLFYAPDDDITTALETIEERCLMAFDGIPGETRKSFEDGTTVFERVLPGADRMYPDTDSAPIPLSEEYIEMLRRRLPSEVIERYRKLKAEGVAEDNFTYIFSKNHYPLIVKIAADLELPVKTIGNFFGQTLKFVENHYSSAGDFDYNQLYELFMFLKFNNLELELAKYILVELYKHPKMDYRSILETIGFKRKTKEEIAAQIPFLKQKFEETARVNTRENRNNWIMGQLRKTALGNIKLSELKNLINS